MLRAPAAFRDFEKRFDKVVHHGTFEAPTGEQFALLSAYGAMDCLADCEDAALTAACDYAHGKHGVLYWRTVPEYRHDSLSGQWGYYMRLLISDKEPK